MEKRDNGTSLEDKKHLDNKTESSDYTTSIDDKGCLGDVQNCSNITAPVKERISNATKDREWIQYATNIFREMMENYDPSIAPYVPGMWHFIQPSSTCIITFQTFNFYKLLQSK